MKLIDAGLYAAAFFLVLVSATAFGIQQYSLQGHRGVQGYGRVASVGSVSFLPNQEASRWLLQKEGDFPLRSPSLVLASLPASSLLLPSSPADKIQISERENNLFAPLAREIVSSRFHEGDTYTWLYSHKSAAFGEDSKKPTEVKLTPSSWERYKIVSVQYPMIIFEMSSKFNEADEYYTHHRMTINIEDQFNAVYDKGDWKIGFEYIDPMTNRWDNFGLSGKNVQAFEEKFNVFIMPPSHQRAVVAARQMRITKRRNDIAFTTVTTVARPKRHSYTNSWYGFQAEAARETCDDLTGVALYKDFGEYSSSLIECEQRSSVDDDDNNDKSIATIKTSYDVTGL